MGMDLVVSRLDDAVARGALADVCERQDVEVLTLFGSALTSPHTARDVDLAVGFRRDASGDLLALLEALMEMLATDTLDLLDLGRAGPTARFAGLVAARPLYELHPRAWATAQMAAALEFYETAWLRRMDLELLAA